MEDEREGTLAQIFFSRLADGAGRRVGPEGFVIGSAVVIAGDSKAGGKGQDEQGGGEGNERGNPGRTAAEPGLRSAAEELRRVEGRKIRTEAIVVALKCGPGGVDQECGKPQENHQRLDPP